MDELKVKPALVQHRRGVHAEVVAEFPVTLLCVEAPGLLAAKIKRREIPAAHQREDQLAVRGGRGGCAVALAAARLRAAFAELALPAFLAVGTEAEQHKVVAGFAGQEDVVAAEHAVKADVLAHPGDLRELVRLGPRSALPEFHPILPSIAIDRRLV